MLYLVEADKDNTEKEDLLKLLKILRLIHQDLAHTYAPKTLNALYSCLASKKLVSTAQKQENSEPTKKYKIVFNGDRISIIGLGVYTIG